VPRPAPRPNGVWYNLCVPRSRFLTSSRRLADLDPAADTLVDEVLEHYEVPGAAVAVVRDDIAYLKPCGVERIGEPARVTETTAFNIGSTSKAFVSTAAAILVADGRLRWDQPIRSIVPELELYDPWISDHVTLRDLCGNRTGLPRTGFCEYGANPDVPLTEILSRLKHTAPIAPFRARFTYVNPGHSAVALAVARVSGCSFLEFLRTRLFEPLGMTHSSGGSAARTLPSVAGWHYGPKGHTLRIEIADGDNYLGSGALWLSASDAAQWLRFNVNGGTVDDRQIVPGAALEETHTPQVLVRREDLAIWIGVPETPSAAYCLGWATSELGGHRLLCHSGSDLGISAQIGVVPSARMGVATYVNKRCPAAKEIVYSILARLLNLTPRDWRALVTDRSLPNTNYQAVRITEDPDPATRPALDLAAYVGCYFHPGNGLATISLAGDRLRVDFELCRLYGMDLAPLGGHAFLPLAHHPACVDDLRVKAEFTVHGDSPVRFYVPEIGEFTRQE